MAEIKKKELNYDVKNIVFVKNEGNTLQHIADTLSIRGRTVFSIIVRFKKRGCTENKPLSGSPRSLDPRDERSLVRRLRTTILVHLGDLTNSYDQHCHRPRQVSQWTAQRCLYQQGYHRSVLKKKMWVGLKSDGMLMISVIKSFLLTRAKFFWVLTRGFSYGGAGMKPCHPSTCVP